MSDHFLHAYNGCNGKSGQSMHSYHSVWMSHWTRRSYEEMIQNHNCSSSSFRDKESCHAANEYQLTKGKEIASNICSPAKGRGEIETGSLKIRNESLKVTSTTTGTQTLGFQSLPTDGTCKNGESTTPIKDSQATRDMEALMAHHIIDNLDSDKTMPSLRSYMPPLLSMASDANRTPSKERYFETEGMLFDGKEHVETYSFLGDSSCAMLRPLSKDLNKSTIDKTQCRLGHGNERISFLPSLMNRPVLASEEQLPQTNPRFVDRENLDFQRHSTFVVCEDKMESHSKSGGSLTSYLQQNKASLFETDPCRINHYLPASGREQFQKTQNISGIKIFQNRSNLPEATKSEKLYHGCSSLHKSPHSLEDLETMRICTTVDTVLPLRGGHPRFSQTTHSLLITKRTDLNSCKEKTSVRNIRESAALNGRAFLQLCSLSPSSGHDPQGVKIHSLGSSSDSEGKENVGDVNPLGRFGVAEDVMALDHSMDSKGKKVRDDPDRRNESSAETDTMDLDDFKEKNPLSSVNSSPSSKVLKMALVTPQNTIGSTSEVGHRQHNTKLSDIDLELPAVPASDNVDPSSSRTQSLNMEALLAHAEQLTHYESDCCLGGSATPEPSSRWIKRLKLSASEPFAFGTKISKDGEGSSHEKNNLSLGKILKGSMASSEPTVSKLHGEDLMVLDKTAVSVRFGESSSIDTTEKGRDSLSSQSWIRRWCHNQSATPQTKPETVVVCEPQSSKLAFEDLQEKQLPSIAAMALMGKAMNGFQPCEFEKRGPLVVWNTMGL